MENCLQMNIFLYIQEDTLLEVLDYVGSHSQGCTKWRTRRTSPPQADFDRAKKWFQNQAEQTF